MSHGLLVLVDLYGVLNKGLVITLLPQVHVMFHPPSDNVVGPYPLLTLEYHLRVDNESLCVPSSLRQAIEDFCQALSSPASDAAKLRHLPSLHSDASHCCHG
eukprot:1803207-Ditylum_brightwellii.AAC.1